MAISKDLKWKLDKIGPYSCGIGSLIGALISIIPDTRIPIYSGESALIIFIISYICCTSTNRKYMIYSNIAIAGSIGGLMGTAISMPIVIICIMMQLKIIGILFYLFLTYIFSYYIAHIAYKGERKGLGRPMQ